MWVGLLGPFKMTHTCYGKSAQIPEGSTRHAFLGLHWAPRKTRGSRLPQCFRSSTTPPPDSCIVSETLSIFLSKMGRESRPVSCHFCRDRKLRCSRVFPCTNCTARGVPCPPVQRAVSRKSSPPGIHPEVLHRLERLEALLPLQTSGPPPISAPPTFVAPSSTPNSQHRLPPKLQNVVKDAMFIDRSCFSTLLIVSAFMDLLRDASKVENTGLLRLLGFGLQQRVTRPYTLHKTTSPASFQWFVWP